MIHRPGLRAVVIRDPWIDSYDVLLGNGSESGGYAATGVDDKGYIIYKPNPDGTAVEPFLRLGHGELEALAKAILAEERPEDATVDALKDARSTRDRLLSMLESRGIR